METRVRAGWVLASAGDMGVSWPAMETWVRAGWVLASNGDMGVCLLVVGQQWTHGCVLAGC